MWLRGLVVGALLLGPSLAAGEVLRPITKAGDAPMLGFVGQSRPDGRVLARQVLPARQADDLLDLEVQDEPEVAALASSRIVYLNKNGVTLQPGDNDSRINRSTIVTTQTAIPAWSVTPSNWSTVVSCMRELFSPFDVQIVESDPGNVPHMEAVFGGSPTQVGMDSAVLGVSPFTTDCSVIENSVVFTFTGAFSFTPRDACEVMAQEVAHSYGLDHVLLASDPMTYLPYNFPRSFRDQTATCGEELNAPRQCGINGSVCRPNQNSVTLLKERLGVAKQIGAPPQDDVGEFDNDVIGGCATAGGNGSALFAFGLLAALTARRRCRRRQPRPGR